MVALSCRTSLVPISAAVAVWMPTIPLNSGGTSAARAGEPGPMPTSDIAHNAPVTIATIFMDVSRSRVRRGGRHARPRRVSFRCELVRTYRAGLHPRIDKCAGLLLRTGCGMAAKSGRPGPADQGVAADMMAEIFQRAAAVAVAIFDLYANLAERLALPHHLPWREMPVRMSGHAIEIGALVADRAAHRGEAMPVHAARDRRLMQPALVALARTVPGRMAIDAARMGQHFSELDEIRHRSLIRRGDRREAVRRRKLVRRRLGDGVIGQHAHRQRRDRHENSTAQFGFHGGPGHALGQVALRIGQDHVADGLVIFDVAGATAQMAVERFENGFLELATRHRLQSQAFQQDLPLVQETRRAVAALKGEMLDERRLQRGQLAILGMAFDGADRLAVEACRRDDAGRAGEARPVGIVDDHRATQALRGAAAELGAGHAEVLAQEIVQGEIVAHVGRAVRASIDRDGECRHASAPLSMCWVTGSDWKRRPVASWIAFRSAATMGIITTSAMPFGCSSGVAGGNTSISRSCSGKSDPRATRYCPRFHCPLPGPSS